MGAKSVFPKLKEILGPNSRTAPPRRACIRIEPFGEWFCLAGAVGRLPPVWQFARLQCGAFRTRSRPPSGDEILARAIEPYSLLDGGRGDVIIRSTYCQTLVPGGKLILRQSGTYRRRFPLAGGRLDYLLIAR